MNVFGIFHLLSSTYASATRNFVQCSVNNELVWSFISRVARQQAPLELRAEVQAALRALLPLAPVVVVGRRRRRQRSAEDVVAAHSGAQEVEAPPQVHHRRAPEEVRCCLYRDEARMNLDGKPCVAA